MSRIESNELSAELIALLDGTNLDGKVGETILLLTMSDQGWPHLAMLSAGEVLAVSGRDLRLALWPNTESGANLKRDGKATLVMVLGGAGHYVEVEADAPFDLVFEDGPLDLFNCRIRSILADKVDYAVLTTGITFELPDQAGILARWRRTVSAMQTL
jgi:hypothetical protein